MLYSELTLLGLPGIETIIDTNYYLKVLVHSSAMAATEVEGIVWEMPVSGIVGNKIGEFAAASFEPDLDVSNNAVFKLQVRAFGGEALSLVDTPLVLLRNTTKTTGIIFATIVEE